LQLLVYHTSVVYISQFITPVWCTCHSLSHQCGVHVTVYKYATVSLHAQDDVNKYLVLIIGVHCDVKLHIVQYPVVCIRWAILEGIV